jgi:O-antigen ligase
MTTTAILLVGGALAALVFWNPFAGLCLMFSSVPIVGSLPAIPFASSLTSLLGGLTLASCLAGAVTRRWTLSLPRDRTYWWILAFGVASLASLAFAATENPIQGIYTYVQMVILVWLTGQLVVTRRRIEVLMLVWILTLVVTQAIGLATFDFSVVGRANRLASLARNPNELAFYSVTGICFALYFLLNARRILSRVLLTAALALGTVSVLLSASRGGFIVLGTVVLYALLSLGFRLVRGLRFSGILIMVVAAFLLTTRLNLPYLPGLIVGLPRTVSSVLAGQSDEARVRIAENGLRAWAGHPVLGVGLGVGAEVGAYSGGWWARTASHSTYLTVLVETGVIGFVLFCGLLLATWLNLSQGPPPEPQPVRRSVGPNWAWRAVFVGFLMMSLTGSLLFNKVLWVTIGVGILLRSRPGILAHPASARE